MLFSIITGHPQKLRKKIIDKIELLAYVDCFLWGSLVYICIQLIFKHIFRVSRNYSAFYGVEFGCKAAK